MFPRTYFPGGAFQIPTTPTASATVLSTTSFRADVGSDAGVTNTLYAEQLGVTPTAFLARGSCVGTGSISVSGLQDSAAYLCYVTSNNGRVLSQPAYFIVSLAAGDTIIEAVVAKFNASGALTALVPNGMWNGEVPEGTDLPYAFAVLEGTRFGHQTEHDNLEIARVCLYCYTAGASLAGKVAAQIQQEYDWCSDLSFTNGNVVQCMKRGYRLTPALARWKDGSAIYVSEVTYEIWVARTSPQ